MDLRNLMFKVGFQGDTAAIEKMDGATSKLGSAIEKTTDKLKGMEKSFGKVGKGLMKKVTAPLVGAGVAGTKMALDLEHGIKKVTTLADAEILPASKIKKEVREISDASGIAQTEIAEAAYSALSAGVDSANVMEFVRSGIDLTRAGFTDMETAIDATTTVLNAYGDKAYEVSKIHDIFVQTQDKGKISVDELGKNIGRVIPTASSLGVNLDQLGASYAILTAKGQNAQLATTNINAMLGELGSTGSKTDKALREMAGKSFAQLTEEGKTVGEVLGMLDEYAKKNSLSLKDMFGSMNAGSAAVTLLSDGVEGFNEMLGEMDGATGKTAENAKTMEDGWFKISRAMEQVKNTLIDVGGAIAPHIEKLAGTVSSLVEKFNALDPGTQTTIVRLVGLAAAVGPVIFGVSKVIGVVGSAISIGTKLVGGISTIVSVLGGPLTLALAAVVAGGIALYKNWDKVSAWGRKVGTSIKESWEGAKNKTIEAWDSMTSKIKGATSKIKGYWQGLKDFLKNPIKGTVNIGRNIWDRFTSKKPDGSHATGLDYVNKDGYIGELHKGEMVLTAKTADKFRKLGGTKDRIPDVINTTSKANSNITNIDSSTQNNLTSNSIKSFANNKNIDNIDKSNIVSSLVKNFTDNKRINKPIKSINNDSMISNLIRNFTNDKNINKSIQNIDSSNLASNLVKSFANNKNINESTNDIDNSISNTMSKFTNNKSYSRLNKLINNKTINKGTVSSMIRNITDKSIAASNLVRNFIKNRHNKDSRTYNEYPVEYTYETYNNYQQNANESETSKQLPSIIFKPQYNIEIKGDATRQEASDLANEVDKRVRKTFYDMFYELQLQMS